MAATALALAIGAKLYPVILVPLFGFAFARRLGWRVTVVAAMVFGAVTLAVLWPMIPAQRLAPLPIDPPPYPLPIETIDDTGPPAPPLPESFSPRDPSQSLRVFLGQWEMNDFFFLIVVENLRPQRDLAAGRQAWFSVMPDSWRETMVAYVAQAASIRREQTPFMITRALLSLVFLAFALCLAWRARGASDPSDWLAAAFATLAWFWLLLPTVNPWYLTWCLPFLPFARNRAWLMLSGLAMLYYLRFWLAFQFANPGIFWTPYNGAEFFDYVATWIEFAPWLCWIAASSVSRRHLWGQACKPGRGLAR